MYGEKGRWIAAAVFMLAQHGVVPADAIMSELSEQRGSVLPAAVLVR